MIDAPLQDGEGDASKEAYHRRIVARLYKRQEWDLPLESWGSVPQALLQIVLDPDSRPREKIAAARVLVSMSQANQQGVGVDARVNNQLGSIIDVPPESPEDVDLDAQEAFYEVVSVDSKKEMLLLAEEMGLTERLLGSKPSSNGHGNGQPGKNGS